MSRRDRQRQEDALRDVDRFSAWGIVVAIIGIALLIGIVKLLGSSAVIVIPVVFGIGAISLARGRGRNR